MNLLDNVSGLKQVKSYLRLLDDYRRTLDKYQKKLETLNETEDDQKTDDSQKTEDSQMTAVQVALDLTYLKEELEEMKPSQEQLSKEVSSLRQMLEEITPTQKEITEKIQNIDTDIIEPVKKNYTANRNAINEKLDQMMEFTERKEKGMKTAIGISLFLNLLTVGALVVVILYMTGLLVF